MPITLSAKKALRQNKRRQKHNQLYKNSVKKIEKEFQGLLSQKKTDEARKILPQAYKILDKMLKEKILKKNTAARKKSRMSRLLNRTS